MAFFFTQFALGYFHHKQFKKTQLPTKLALPHRMFGHMIISIGIANAYLYVQRATPALYFFYLDVRRRKLTCPGLVVSHLP